jgi:hypothetical protein
MNTTKRFLMTFLAIWLALATIAGSWSGASAAGGKGIPSITADLFGGDDTDVYLKRGGVYFQNSAYYGEIDLSRPAARDLPLETFRLRSQNLALHRTFLQFSVNKTSGSKVSRLRGLVYVYFNLSRAERKLWDQGMLAIYTYDAHERQWSECLANRYVTRSEQGRVACIATLTGLYAMAEDVGD